MKAFPFETLSKKRAALIALFGISTVALSLRIYDFHDWIRFNNDQVRDAIIVDKMLEGEEITLLGPKAGGTGFNLGPAFYYMNYVAAILFGNSPDTFASVSVILFIASIPVFFSISRKLFGTGSALLLTLLYSVSFFGIKYSRFSWNPNILPVFTLLSLYGIHKVFRHQKESGEEAEHQKTFLWTIATGIAIGIGVQLHTILLFLLPGTFTIGMVLSWFRGGKNVLRKATLVFALVVLTNIPQIAYEWKSGGENSRALLAAFTKKTGDEDRKSGEKSVHAFTCFAQGNMAVLTGVGFSDDCDLLSKKSRQRSDFWAIAIASFVFSTGGMLLAIRRLLLEKDPGRKNLFEILLSYSILSFLLLIPLGDEISLRFFIAVYFLPFLLFGSWISFVREKLPKIATIPVILALFAALSTNAILFSKTYVTESGESKYYGGTPLRVTDPIAKHIASDILSRNNPDGNHFILEYEGAKATEYLAKKYGAKTVDAVSWGTLRENIDAMNPDSLYFVDDIETGKKPIDPEKRFVGFSVTGRMKVGTYDVIRMEPKNH